MEAPIIIDNGSYEIKFGPNTLETPYKALNCLTKDKYNHYYLSNQLKKMKEISHTIIRRPHELGHLVSWELEQLIWDYCFFNKDEFQWSINDTKEKDLIVSETSMTLPELSKNLDQVIFEEYEFNSMFKGPVAQFVPFNLLANYEIFGDYPQHSKITKDYKDFQLVIDSGFNCTWVIPIIKGIPFYKAVKKLDMGGRFLNGLLKETISFRHYNVMEETILINNIKEKCCFTAPVSYFQSFQNKNDTQLEYVLPDFQTSFIGYIRNKSEKISKDCQTLILQDELFSIPETFFHPEIASLIKPGIVETILESVSMVPELFRPLMISNIVVTGGNFNINNFAQRLCTELQRQCPTDWNVRVHLSKIDSSIHGWECMKLFSLSESYLSSRVTREEYLEHGLDWCTKNRFGYQKWL